MTMHWGERQSSSVPIAKPPIYVRGRRTGSKK